MPVVVPDPERRTGLGRWARYPAGMAASQDTPQTSVFALGTASHA
jgi:hypothetical protein